MSLPPRPPQSPQQAATPNAVKFGKISKAAGHRTLIYGPGGIGKSTLACKLPGKTGYLDKENTLPILAPQLEAAGILGNIYPVEANSWPDILAALAAPGWDEMQNVVLDSGTKSEELLISHILATVKGDTGQRVERLEDYGWGKHVRIVYEAFLPLLDLLEAHAKAGRNVVIIAHECTSVVPNPEGNDYLRYEPRLFAGSKKGENSVRARVKEWSDHTLFMGYDVAVQTDKKGAGNKAKGSGTRTIYTSELPFCLAKSRTAQGTIEVTDTADVWSQILK